MFVPKSKYKELLEENNHLMEILCTKQKRIDEQEIKIHKMQRSRLEARRTVGVGKKKHRELYVGINDTAFIDGRPFYPYRENLVIEGRHLEHYKWSWKENKAVKVEG